MLTIQRRTATLKQLISSERPFKIKQNDTKIIKIYQAVLNFKNREKTTEKPKMLFFRGFTQTEEQWIVLRQK